MIYLLDVINATTSHECCWYNIILEHEKEEEILTLHVRSYKIVRLERLFVKIMYF